MLAHTQKNPELGNNDKDTYTKKTYARNYHQINKSIITQKWAMEKNNTMKEEECGKGCSACGLKFNGNKVRSNQMIHFHPQLFQSRTENGRHSIDIIGISGYLLWVPRLLIFKLFLPTKLSISLINKSS
jgi:hypothetical protein